MSTTKTTKRPKKIQDARRMPPEKPAPVLTQQSRARRTEIIAQRATQEMQGQFAGLPTNSPGQDVVGGGWGPYVLQ